jgi:hypothetical protein
LTAAAKVEFEFAEDGGGPGDLHRQRADALLGLACRLGGVLGSNWCHVFSFKNSFVVNLLSDKIHFM